MEMIGGTEQGGTQRAPATGAAQDPSIRTLQMTEKQTRWPTAHRPQTRGGPQLDTATMKVKGPTGGGMPRGDRGGHGGLMWAPHSIIRLR